MDLKELDIFLQNNQEISYSAQDGYLFFKHDLLDGYGECLRVEYSALKKINENELMRQIVKGRNIAHITRVTGYFSKVSGWNKGKTGELKDRQRIEI